MSKLIKYKEELRRIENAISLRDKTIKKLERLQKASVAERDRLVDIIDKKEN